MLESIGVMVSPIIIDRIRDRITVIGIILRKSPSRPEIKAIGKNTKTVVSVPVISAGPISEIAAVIALIPFLPFPF